MNMKVDGDPVRIRELAEKFGVAGKKWAEHFDVLQKGLILLMRECADTKMDQFKLECRKSSKDIDEMGRFLADTKKYLEGVAIELDNI
jgi:hypothetical protein